MPCRLENIYVFVLSTTGYHMLSIPALPIRGGHLEFDVGQQMVIGH